MILRQLLISLGIDFDRRGADQAQNSISGLTRAAHTLAGAFAFQKVYQGLTGMLDQASAAQDRLAVLKQTFKGEGDQVVAWTELAAEGLGRSKYSLQEYASSFGSLLVPAMKGNTKQAAEMSTALAGLSVDLGSFFHIADDEALWRLRSGMLGSTIAVDNLGIELHDAALKVFAKDQGLKYDKGMDPQQKMILRYKKIMHDAANAQGWAAKTSKEYDNQLRKFKETIKTLATDIGMQLIPSGTAVVTMMGDWAAKFGEVAKSSNIVGAALGLLGGYLSLLALQWSLANIPLLIAIGFLGLLALVIDDVYTSLEGGDGYFKEWFENAAGKDAWDTVIATWKQGKSVIESIVAGDWGAVSDKIYDFANPNSSANDRLAMEQQAYDAAARDARFGVNKTTRDRGMATLEAIRNGSFRLDTGRQVLGQRTNSGVGPLAGGGAYNAGVTVVVNGNASPSTARDVGRAAERALAQHNRDLYQSSGRFNVTQGGTGLKYFGEVFPGMEGPEK